MTITYSENPPVKLPKGKIVLDIKHTIEYYKIANSPLEKLKSGLEHLLDNYKINTPMFKQEMWHIKLYGKTLYVMYGDGNQPQIMVKYE